MRYLGIAAVVVIVVAAVIGAALWFRPGDEESRTADDASDGVAAFDRALSRPGPPAPPTSAPMPGAGSPFAGGNNPFASGGNPLGAPPAAPALPPPAEVAAHVPDVPPIDGTEFVNTGADAAYVGADRCAECHADVHADYSETTHAHSFREVAVDAAPPDGELHHEPSGRFYRVYREGDQLHHREFMRDAEGNEVLLADYALDYVVGSGNHAHTYLVKVGDFVAESPVTWFSSQKNWAMSPGYEQANHGFSRPVYFECLNCHTGRVEPRENNRGKIAVHTHNIDCERCHGPGSLHVAKWTESPGSLAGIDPTIVHPGKLDRQRGEAVCAQCHLHGAAQAVVRDRSIEQYRPGQSLSDYLVNYVIQNADRSMTVVGHAEQLRLSRCYTEAETLTCITCHEPHQKPPVENSVEYFKAKCMTCHTTESCGMELDARLERHADDNCMACHMPETSTEVIHVTATHHRIGIHTPESASPLARSAQAGELVPIDKVDHLPELDRDRCLGLAYLHASQQDSRPEISEAYRVRARDILLRVHGQGLGDAEVSAALAQIFLIDDPNEAIRFGVGALQAKNLEPATEVKALYAVSQALVNMRQTQPAVPYLERLVTLRRQAADWFLLAACQFHNGDLDGALRAAQNAAEIMPARPTNQELMGAIYRSRGEMAPAEEHEQRAALLREAAQPKAPSGG